MASGCLDEGTVVAFLDGGLAAADLPAVESHLEACGACADLVTWAAADQAHRSRSAGHEGRPFVGQLAPGSRIDRYQILSAVGRGGMGEVYAAYHPDLDRRIALKVVGESAANAPEQRARLLREARAIARLSHPNVVAVYDAGTVDERVYIAMEFVEGETVDEWLRSKPRGWREILDVFIAAGRGLAAAHAAGVVHRDFKPQNVMVGRDGSVRVMDFGLARFAEEPTEVIEPMMDDVQRRQPATVTKPGALVGTLGYMAPEQFRGESPDARADQFSFCAAFHEAIFGSRPVLPHLQGHALAPEPEKPVTRFRSSGAPAWLRDSILRGLSQDRDGRFSSMEALISAVTRGRTRGRRRASAIAVGLTAILVSLGGWRFASARRISCLAPNDRLASAWVVGDERNPRRQAIHRAFLATGRTTAEASWLNVAKILDTYVTEWSNMYVEACEATHVRGEQSGDVLDLRMRCLSEELDDVRALTNVFVVADATAVSRAGTAVQSLTPVNRCADVTVLRSAVPLPRDEATLRTVRELRAMLKQARAVIDLGDRESGGKLSISLRSRVDATGYRPLQAELLELIGHGEMYIAPRQAERTLERAFLTAEACGDDVTAVKAASHLIYTLGYQLGRHEDSERWAQIAYALLDRLGAGHSRLRAWVLNDHATAVLDDFDRARRLFEESARLKAEALGEEHPDFAVTLDNLSWALTALGRPAEGLAAAERVEKILSKNGQPDDWFLANAQTNHGLALVALGRYAEGERYLMESMRVVRSCPDSMDMPLGDTLNGLAYVRLEQKRPTDAIPLFEEALSIRERAANTAFFTAETRFGLARALWESGRDRKRALSLAEAARVDLAWPATAARERVVAGWLGEHKARGP